MMMDPNPNADRTNVHSRSVNADAGPDRANVSPDARSVPAIATCVIDADAADDRTRFSRHESDSRSREAQSNN
jgi:hypothetical protein